MRSPPAFVGAQWPSSIELFVWESIAATCKNGFQAGPDGVPTATCQPGSESTAGGGIWGNISGSCVRMKNLEFISL